eukprot:TRINITY_DN5617_c0_g2_i1.p2 TRINITY_DN5617_c0_g2~~TRINITY_DN5617_c0_g2_i1.p2  ORF type:complete len:106 (+),score=4.94 TRINITY_DN5617_c0_g2_i1:520-837(+)
MTKGIVAKDITAKGSKAKGGRHGPKQEHGKTRQVDGLHSSKASQTRKSTRWPTRTKAALHLLTPQVESPRLFGSHHLQSDEAHIHEHVPSPTELPDTEIPNKAAS